MTTPLETPSSEPSAPSKPLFTVFYTQHVASSPPPTSSDPLSAPTLLAIPPTHPGLGVIADACADNAEELFFRSIETLKSLHPEWDVTASDEQNETGGKVAEKVTLTEGTKGSGSDVFKGIQFWPPLETGHEDVGEEW